MQSTGQASMQAVSFVPMQGSAMTYAMGHLHCLSPYACLREDSNRAISSAALEAIANRIQLRPQISRPWLKRHRKEHSRMARGAQRRRDLGMQCDDLAVPI